LQKLSDQKVRKIFQEKVDEIIADPTAGKLLEHPFRKYQIRSVAFDFLGNSYRVAYTQNDEKNELVFLLMDSRENFYEKLKNFAK